MKFSAPVTIRSADPKHLASFRSVRLSGVGNLSLVAVRFGYVSKAGAPEHVKPNEIDRSQGIVIANSVFDGDLAHGVSSVADGYGTGFGLYVCGLD